MLILIMAVMSGAKSLYAIEDFAQRHQQHLYELFSRPLTSIKYCVFRLKMTILAHKNLFIE